MSGELLKRGSLDRRNEKNISRQRMPHDHRHPVGLEHPPNLGGTLGRSACTNEGVHSALVNDQVERRGLECQVQTICTEKSQTSHANPPSARAHP